VKLLVLDAYGGDGGLDFCMRAQQDGHEVRWSFLMTERTRNFGKGLVTRTEDWRSCVSWADLIVLTDNTKHLRALDALRASERCPPIVGASVQSAAWELDRKTGQQVFKQAGIAIPPFREFSDYDSAIAYVKREGRAFVSKPSYDEADKSLSYVAKSPADLVYMLERWKRAQKLKGAFILQEKVSGCEMAVGAWCGPHGFNSGWCENWEFKSLMAGDKGPNVGEMGTVLRFVSRSKLADKVLRPLEDRLVRMGYTGYVDVNCIIDDEGNPWPLEFTMRMGWPTFNIQQALVQGDHVQWLADLCAGRDSKPFKLDSVATGVVMALPDFPYNKTPLEKMTGVPILGMVPSVEKHVHLCQAMQGKAPQDQGEAVETGPCWVTAGDYVLVASGVGDSVRSARTRAYRVLDKIKIPASAFWRVDIGQRLKAQLPQIQSSGYASNMLF
jgi:phosphoribosylamine--glycine ligase